MKIDLHEFESSGGCKVKTCKMLECASIVSKKLKKVLFNLMFIFNLH